MTSTVLIAYATKKGSTREVAESIAARLASQDVRVVVQPARDRIDLRTFDAVVLGGALYMGRWHRDARRFLRRHRERLSSVPVAVFAMGPPTLEDHAVASSRHQLERALARVPAVRPVAVTVFGGVIDPRRLRFPFSRVPASDARDWNAIGAWADEVAGQILRLALPA